MQDFSKEAINQNEIQRLQNEFCKATGLCVYCVDSKGERITEISGSQEQIERLQEFAKLPQVDQALERVWEGSLEDLAVEDLNDDGDKVAAIAVRIGDCTLLYWMAFLVRPGKKAETMYFFDTLDLLQDASTTFINTKITGINAEVESMRSRSAEQEISKSYRNMSVLVETIRLLDSDEEEKILLDRWLNLICEYFQVDTAQIYQINYETDTMDVVCEWLNEGQHSFYDRTGRLPIPRLLQTEKPIIISSDTTDNELRKYLKAGRLQALIQHPIIRQEGKGCLMLSLNHRKRHIWRSDEIGFSYDSVRVLQNVFTRRMQKKSLTSSYQALGMVLDNVGCAVYVTDTKNGRLLFANRMLQSTFGEELKNNTFEDLLERGMHQGQDSGVYEIHHVQKERWYDLMYKDIAWVEGEPARLYSLYDITDKKAYQRKIEQQAYTDFLTGLYNRMCCERDLARQVDKAKKSGQTGALLYMDIDNFKHINDGLGHQYGDVLLKTISHALQKVPGIEETCYRMGGDEFVIVVPPDKYGEFDRIMEDISQIFTQPWFLKDADYYCTMSMGIVTFPDLGDSVTDLVKKADIAMYEAKRRGKNCIVSYKDGLTAVAGRRLNMERDMRDATVEGCDEFEIYYQPIIDVEGEPKCAGAEALIRWNSTNLGFIPPTEFIPLAEYLGLINPIGNFVLREACTQCRKWNENGRPDFKVNVNLSVVQLLQTDVADIVEQTIKETGILPKNLTLEVTESMAINDMGRMKEILNRIKAMGVKIALDDFGTGYSSLNHIREIPLDLIKVDQSFVEGLTEDAYSRSFIKMVAELAGTLDVSVCVEGIENADQYSAVKDLNIKYIQGFYFDRPLKSEDFIQKYVANQGENV